MSAVLPSAPDVVHLHSKGNAAVLGRLPQHFMSCRSSTLL